jgi:FAD:protein FMN transferase
MRHPSANAASSTRRLRIALGTWVAIEAARRDTPASHTAATSTPASDPALDAINAAYATVTEIEARVHPTRAGSDLALINSTAPGTPLAIHPDTWRLLQLSRHLYDLTEGVFDPCVPQRPGRMQDIEINPGTPLLMCHAPVQLDLGGIAKGYAIDRAIETLIQQGCTSGLVNAGGDVRVFGARTETILLRQRAADTQHTYKPVELTNEALAVSDLDATERPQEHQGYYNRPGNAPTQRHYAAVVAKNATTADALTKCVLLCPEPVTERVLKELAGKSL